MHRALSSVALVCVAFFYAFSAQAMVRVDQRFNQAFQLDEYSCLSFQINFLKIRVCRIGTGRGSVTCAFRQRIPWRRPTLLPGATS